LSKDILPGGAVTSQTAAVNCTNAKHKTRQAPRKRIPKLGPMPRTRGQK